MKKLSFYLALTFVLLCSSCATSMEMNKTATLEVPETFSYKSEPEMEFIGFKADANMLSTNRETITNSFYWRGQEKSFPSEYDLWRAFKSETSLGNMGTVLQNAKVAYDQSFAYFGIYSLQELELYKSRKRFITFIEVNKNRLTGVEKGTANTLIGTMLVPIGGILVMTGGATSAINPELKDISGPLIGVGVGASVLGGIFLLIPSKTILNFEGQYQIYVYDTEVKEIVYKDAVIVSEEDTYSGSYFNQNTNVRAVNEYYANLVYNAILKKYVEIDRFITNYTR